MEHTQCRSGFIGHSVLVQKYLFLFGFLLCTSASAFAATSIQIISQPGDYIGQGANQTFTTVTGNSFGSQAGVSFSAGGYNYDFEAATGILVVGEQSAATRYPFNDPGIPGLNVSGNGRGCNDLTGRFIVHELEFGAGTTINKAAIDFEQHCEDALPALFGFIRYNSTLGVLDQDADTVSDIQDNCPADDNADQLDTDGDKVGDACDPVLGTTLVTMQSSSPADWVGLGKSYQFTMASGGVYMSHDTDTGYAEVKAGDFTFEFSGVGVNPLAVGAYPGATRHPFNLSTEPGLSVSGEGRGCNQLVGSFNVLELVRGNDGMVKNFAADFIQYCDEGPALKGLVMFNSNLFAHAGAKLGSTVNFAGDVDADGFGDYVMGAPAYTVAAVPPQVAASRRK